MKRIIKILLCMVLCLNMVLPAAVYAREGDCGYEGGISSGEAPGKTTYDYQEVSFVSGEPVVFKGTLALKKSLKQNTIVSTYTYNLKNNDKTATLTRTLVYNTVQTTKDNGQTIEETSLSGTPLEAIKIGSTTYTMTNYDFTRSAVLDSKPAINYYAGNLWGKKTYQIGAAANGDTVTVEETGSFYGYDQYWGTTEVEDLSYMIQTDQKKGTVDDKWGGTANVSLSATTTQQLKFEKNEPNQISFEGGYIQTQNNSSILEYTSKLPEFDKDGVSTDNMLDANDSLKLETFPVETRLPVPNLTHLRGHWAEDDIDQLFSLEVFTGGDATFNPEQYITRGEFTAAMVQAARAVPPDPSLSKTTVKATPTPKPTPTPNPSASPKPTSAPSTAASSGTTHFGDVSTDNAYYSQIQSAFERGLISGNGDNNFEPDSYLTLADAITIFVRAIGLEGMAPNPGAVTTFRDNDQIPDYARNAAFVAQKIGLVQGDDKGYLNPGANLTKARAAALINRFINYMRSGITNDYREGIVNYQ